MEFFGYSFSKNLYWVNNKEGVVVVDDQHQRSYVLESAESVLWRLLINQIDAEAIVRQFSIIISVPEDQIMGKILSIIEGWKKNDLVERMNG